MKKCIEETSRGYQCFGAGANPFCRNYGQTRQRAEARAIFTLSPEADKNGRNQPICRRSDLNSGWMRGGGQSQ